MPTLSEQEEAKAVGGMSHCHLSVHLEPCEKFVVLRNSLDQTDSGRIELCLWLLARQHAAACRVNALSFMASRIWKADYF